MDRLSDDVKLAVIKTVLKLAKLVEVGGAVTASRLIEKELDWPRTPNEKVTDFMRWRAEQWKTAERGPLDALWWMFGAIIREGSKKMTTGFAADLRALIKEAGEKDGLTVNIGGPGRPNEQERNEQWLTVWESGKYRTKAAMARDIGVEYKTLLNCLQAAKRARQSGK